MRDRSLGEFLEEVAAAEPSITGGGVNAVTVAAAAGLVTMSARLSTTMDAAEDTAAEAEQLRAEAMTLSDADGRAYNAVLQAQRLPADAPGRRAALSAALADAADPPLRLAELAADIARLAAEVATVCKKPLRGDAITAAELAAAVARASTALARTNLTAAGHGWEHDGDAERTAKEATRHAANAAAVLDG